MQELIRLKADYQSVRGRITSRLKACHAFFVFNRLFLYSVGETPNRFWIYRLK